MGERERDVGGGGGGGPPRAAISEVQGPLALPCSPSRYAKTRAINDDITNFSVRKIDENQSQRGGNVRKTLRENSPSINAATEEVNYRQSSLKSTLLTAHKQTQDQGRCDSTRRPKSTLLTAHKRNFSARQIKIK